MSHGRIKVTQCIMQIKLFKQKTIKHYNLGKEVDFQYLIKAISSNFAGFNISLKTKHIERFQLKTIKPSS